MAISIHRDRSDGSVFHVGVEPAARKQFVELPSPVVVSKQCLVELDNRAGATMRVQLVGYDVADVEALARSFWNAD